MGQISHEGQTEDDKGEIFMGTEFEGHSGEGDGKKHEPDNPECPRNERPERRHAQGRTCSTFERHLVTIHTGDYGSRLAGNVDKDRGGGAAVHGAVVETCQHNDGPGRRNLKGYWEQDGDGPHRADPGKHPDQGPQHRTEKAEEEIFWLKGNGKAIDETIQSIQLHSL